MDHSVDQYYMRALQLHKEGYPVKTIHSMLQREGMKEELRRLKAKDEIRDLLESEGRIADAVAIEAAIGLPTAEKRKAFIQTLPKRAAAAGPRSSAPQQFQESQRRQAATETKVEKPGDAAAFFRGR